MNVVYLVLLGLALTALQVLIGGTRELFALPAYAIVGLLGLVSLIDLRRPKLPANGLCLASSALFFGLVLARTLTSPVEYLARFDRYMVLAGLIVYLVTACLLTDPRRRLWVLWILLGLATANVVLGARQFATGIPSLLFGLLPPLQYVGRACGLYVCPDHLAGFLEVVACLALAVATWSRTRAWVKLLSGYLALCCLGGIVISASRGGFLSATAGLAVLISLGLFRVRASSPGLLPRVIVVLVVLGGLVGTGVWFAVQSNHMLLDRAQNLVSKDIRPKLWPAAILQFEQAPAFGTGSATYLYYGRRFRDPTVQLDPVRPHSDYLELLAEYGAVSAAALLLFLGTHLWWGWRTFSRLSLRFGGEGPGGSNAAAWNIGSMSAVTCLLVHSVVDFNLHIPANVLLLAFVFGTLANPGRAIAGDDQTARRRPIDLLPRLALPALAIWLLVEAMPKAPGDYYEEQARIALRDKHYVAAIGLAQHGLETEKASPMLYYYMAEARLNIANQRESSGLVLASDPIVQSYRTDALDAYRDAIVLAPYDSVLLMRAGETLTRLGRLDEAESILDHLLEWDPNSGNAQTYYGFFLQRAGRFDEAETAYRRALALDYNQAAVLGLAQIGRERAARSSPTP